MKPVIIQLKQCSVCLLRVVCLILNSLEINLIYLVSFSNWKYVRGVFQMSHPIVCKLFSLQMIQGANFS